MCIPGCLSLSGPSSVTGIVGGSLSVKCRYQEKFRNNNKYWCKHSCLLSRNIVETTESKTEVTRGRVSIRDHPANLTFTVTLESLRKEDAGTYRCGIDTSWLEGIFRDPTFQVEVSVVPGEPCTPLPLYQQQGHLTVSGWDSPGRNPIREQTLCVCVCVCGCMYIVCMYVCAHTCVCMCRCMCVYCVCVCV